ncbi:phage holin family protein [Actinomyces vulturis]|uniref:phage holin family protein n=1 Tax=Actinomyces vulturis TaxID=1857645 RepID=UPI000835A1EE|nr:phage holin family protein [Actinomyces vulturis]
MTQSLPPQAPAETSAKPSSTVGELVARISENVSALISGEIELAKAKAKQMGSKMGLGIGLLAGAGILALYGLGFLFSTFAKVLEIWLHPAASYGIVTAAIFIVVIILALVGKSQIDKGKQSTPTPQAGFKADVEVMKSSLQAGLKSGEAK